MFTPSLGLDADLLAEDEEPRSRLPAPGKMTLTARLLPGSPRADRPAPIAGPRAPGPVQTKAWLQASGRPDLYAAPIERIAADGLAGSAGPLPYADVIAPLFGRHDVSGIAAHQDGAARAAATQMGAEAYATGDHVAFGGAPTLHTAAHEATHVIQQRAGVSLAGGVGAAGDRYEQHADAVADRIVAGRSAEDLLDEMAGVGGGAREAVQHKLILDTPPKGKPGVSADKIIEMIVGGRVSPELDDAIRYLYRSNTSHLRIRFVELPDPAEESGSSSKKAKTSSSGKSEASASGATAPDADSHGGGHTAILLGDGTEVEPRLVVERVLTDPMQLFAGPWAIVCTIGVRPSDDPAQVAATILHELELHAVHAAALLVRLDEHREREAGLDAAIGTILKFYQRPDDHGDVARLEAYVRSAAKTRDALAGTPWEGWANAVFSRAAADAIDHLAVASMQAHDDGGAAKIEALGTLIDQLRGGNAPAEQRHPSQAPMTWTKKLQVPEKEAQGQIMDLALEDVPLETICERMATGVGYPRQQTIAYYNRIIVPALWKNAPKDTPDAALAYMVDHGCPELTARQYLVGQGMSLPDQGLSATLKNVEVPKEAFDTGDGEDDWTPLTNHYVPRAVVEAAYRLSNGQIITIDGNEMRVRFLSRQVDSSTKLKDGRYIVLLIPLRGG